MKQFFGILFLLWLPAFAVSQPTVLDRIVAVVGKECILLSDLNAQVDFYVYNNRLDPNTPGLKKQVLESMVNERLIATKALEDTTITVSEDEVNQQLDLLIAQRIQQVGSEKRLEELYGMPINRMKREFRDEMRKQIAAQKYQQVKFGDIHPSRREVEEFFEKYRDSLPRVPEELELYHIFKIPQVSQEMKETAKKMAQSILDSIRSGGDFADFARRYSEDRGSASAGGDLGFHRRGQFVKEYEEVVFGMQENELVGPIESVFGYHIVQLLERRGDAVHSRHILLKVKEDSSAAQKATDFLLSLKDSVANGKDFSELARRYSDDKETAQLGGLLGRYTINQFDKSLLTVVNTLKEGEISDPVEVEYGTTKGYHIVYVKKRIPEHAMNLQDDWKRLEQLARNYKQSVELQKWLDEIRKEVYWSIRLEQQD
jgi:peptidyl-prolyl cis-trans isomerase SurA